MAWTRQRVRSPPAPRPPACPHGPLGPCGRRGLLYIQSREPRAASGWKRTSAFRLRAHDGESRPRDRGGASIATGGRLDSSRDSLNGPVSGAGSVQHFLAARALRRNDSLHGALPASVGEASSVRAVARRVVRARPTSSEQVAERSECVLGAGVRQAREGTQSVPESLLPCNRLLNRSRPSSVDSSPPRVASPVPVPVGSGSASDSA